jgi:hypothetical protein
VVIDEVRMAKIFDFLYYQAVIDGRYKEDVVNADGHYSRKVVTYAELERPSEAMQRTPKFYRC